MGFEVLGDNDSPVMAIMLYNPAKIPAFSRECLKQSVAVVTAAFPATPLLLARARICLSASHTKEDLIKALEVISQVGDLVGIKYFHAEPEKQQLEERMKLECNLIYLQEERIWRSWSKKAEPFFSLPCYDGWFPLLEWRYQVMYCSFCRRVHTLLQESLSVHTWRSLTINPLLSFSEIVLFTI